MTDEKATLGCGSLILITLIVILFSGSGTKDLRKDISELRSELKQVQSTLEAQTQLIQSLEEKLSRVRAKE